LRQLGAMASIAPPPVITVSLKSVIPQFMAVGSVPTSSIGPPPGAGATIIISTDNGVTWKSQMSGSSVTLNCIHLAYSRFGYAEFIAVGESGTILTSSDGVTWNPQHSGTSETLWRITGMTGFPSRPLVAVGENGTILTSSDGVNWTLQTFPP
jgi:photosystem II stability/assembly factor-like uncharacterized protein